jgi:predicted transposase/invertase (TIGR01784 family)
LIDFLNSALEFNDEKKIVDLTVINPVMPTDTKKRKKAVFDVRTVFNDGEQAIVEMQFFDKHDFKKRSQFVISKAYVNQDISGQNYNALKKCYLIAIVNFNLFDDKDIYASEFRFRDKKGVNLTDDETILFLELTKINKLLKKPVEELTDLELWLIFFKYAANHKRREKLNEIIKKKEGIAVALSLLTEISSSVEERIQYENELLFELDENSRIYYAELPYKKALAELEAQKKAAEAENQAAQAEKQAAQAVADKALHKQQNAIKNLLAQGILSDEQIAGVFGITANEVLIMKQ